MIDIYVWSTPNGRKPLILLEELGVEYRMVPVDLGKQEQHAPSFLKLNPNGRIPAMVDEPGTPSEIRVFESGAILIHLAEKHGRFLPKEGQARADALAWLMFQMGGVGPMLGQYGHFKRHSEAIPYAIDRYKKEGERLLGVLDGRLGEVPFLAGEYGIADMATYPWVEGLGGFGFDLAPFTHLTKWIATIAERPAVKKAMSLRMK
jgi:GST-like protein